MIRIKLEAQNLADLNQKINECLGDTSIQTVSHPIQDHPVSDNADYIESLRLSVATAKMELRSVKNECDTLSDKLNSAHNTIFVGETKIEHLTEDLKRERLLVEASELQIAKLTIDVNGLSVKPKHTAVESKPAPTPVESKPPQHTAVESKPVPTPVESKPATQHTAVESKPPQHTAEVINIAKDDFYDSMSGVADAQPEPVVAPIPPPPPKPPQPPQPQPALAEIDDSGIPRIHLPPLDIVSNPTPGNLSVDEITAYAEEKGEGLRKTVIAMSEAVRKDVLRGYKEAGTYQERIEYCRAMYVAIQNKASLVEKISVDNADFIARRAYDSILAPLGSTSMWDTPLTLLTDIVDAMSATKDRYEAGVQEQAA